MTETLAHGYSSESTQRELSIEYQHDRIYMIFKNLCVLVLWTKVASALGGLMNQGRRGMGFTQAYRTPSEFLYALLALLLCV